MQADQAGQYIGACAEYCGSQHAWMRILVMAETPEDFAKWEQATLAAPLPPETDDAARGARRFREMTCVRCHSIKGNGDTATAAPDLTHLASRKTLGAGVMKNSPDELARWLREPQSVKQGSHMPDVQLSDQDVKDFVAYFESLK
jgi:cytochrome c oxidase subunit 2